MKKSLNRPDWDAYFLEIAEIVKKRSNCIRLQVGAIIVKDKRIISTGYSGTPAGIKNCFEGGCERCAMRDAGKIDSGEDKHKCICIHAEQNALIQAAYHGISTKDSVMYTTHVPCIQCAKLIINSGIKKIISGQPYSDTLGLELLKKAGIEFKLLKREG